MANISHWAGHPLLTVMFFVALVVCSIAGAMTVGLKGDEQRYDELFKFFLTLAQVGGIGGIAALAIETYRQREAQRQRVDAQRRQMFSDARKSYDMLKRTRRLLQDELKTKHPAPGDIAASLARPQGNQGLVKTLNEYGRTLFEPQLLLESLNEQAQYSHDVPRAAALASYFQRMERCANHVSDALRSAPHLSESHLAALSDFLASEKFRQDFKEPYHRSLEILLNR